MTKHYAKMAQPFVHAPLFRSLEKGQQSKLKLDITYTVTNTASATTTTFRFWGPEPLGATDLRVMQGLVASATGQLRQEGATGLFRDGGARRKCLNLTGDALDHDVIATRFKLYSFSKSLGYTNPSSQTLNRLADCIKRLSAVTVIASKPGSEASYHLLSGYERDTVTDDVVVGLNPTLTAAVLGKNDFLFLDFDEVLKLKSDAARLIHSRLHWINQGLRRRVSMETLCEYVYADAPTSASAERQRRKTVRTALEELTRLAWGVYEPTPGNFTIQRPKQARRSE